MHVVRRLVWWKCLFWVAAGCGVGAAVATFLPEPGPPVGAQRVPIERLAVALSGDPSTGNANIGAVADAFEGSASNVVLFPPHGSVQLIDFDFRTAAGTGKAYAYANTPMLTRKQLQNSVDARSGNTYRASRLQQALRGLVAEKTTTAAEDAALIDIARQPGGRWTSAAEFLDHVHAKRPAFIYGRAWWAEAAWRRDAPVAAGAVLVGLLGTLLTLRSAEDVAAADLLRSTRVAPAAVPVPTQSKDLAEVEALDAILAAKLTGDTVDDDEAPGRPPDAAARPAVVKTLTGGPLEVAAPAAAEERKDYAGEFYPTVRRAQPKAFSLVELLVSIGIIAILIAILLPALIGARRSADTIVCSSNLHGIGLGMTLYLNQNQNTFPPAYLYIGHKIENGIQTPTSPSAGYIHWSSYLYGTGGVAKNAFTCPAMRQGGLPPTNTPQENRDAGQTCPSDTVVDQQAPRLAYTVNEVLCPRNKFISRSFGADRVYRFVKATEVAHSATVILGTEMIDNALAISYNDTSTGWIMSHRPVSGFVGLEGELDMYLLPVGTKFRPATAADLDADPNSVGDATHTRLDLVGRNHGKRTGYPDQRVSNFLYCDGHVETKSVYDTVSPAFEWGDKFYSLTPNDDQIDPATLAAGAGTPTPAP